MAAGGVVACKETLKRRSQMVGMTDAAFQAACAVHEAEEFPMRRVFQTLRREAPELFTYIYKVMDGLPLPTFMDGRLLPEMPETLRGQTMA